MEDWQLGDRFQKAHSDPIWRFPGIGVPKWMIYHGKFHKIPIEMDDDWGYPNFRKPPREGRNRRHGQPFSSHGHAGQENCENCEPPLKKVKESKPELIGERA